MLTLRTFSRFGKSSSHRRESWRPLRKLLSNPWKTGAVVTSSSVLEEIVSRVSISQVAEAHAIPLDRTRRRAVAKWRGGKRFSVALDDEKNVFHDKVTNQGGGLVTFTQLIRGCDKKTAVQWLAHFAGVQLQELTDDDRRFWAQRIGAVRRNAEALVAWKAETLNALRYERGRLQLAYHNAVRFILSNDAGECRQRGDVRYELALRIRRTFWPRVEEMDEQIDQLEAASYADLLRRFGDTAA